MKLFKNGITVEFHSPVDISRMKRAGYVEIKGKAKKKVKADAPPKAEATKSESKAKAEKAPAESKKGGKK